MECQVCGKSYSVTHECAGPVPPIMGERETAPVPGGFAPLYYMQLAWGIMRWDDVSVRRASIDPRALLYGIALSTPVALIVLLSSLSPAISASLDEAGFAAEGIAVRLITGVILLPVAAVLLGLTSLLQLALCHLIAKSVLGASGTFVRIMRPLSLGWPINVLTVIPIVGPLLAALLWAAVLMVVFEEVNHIRRLQAFVVSYGVGLLFLGVGRFLQG